ncbi:MAG: hypothetical protein EAZ40_01805 [Rhodobacterales bacterium]|nr:MAG: hypothetical protein EAZ40_01805 [Rhodobacterales bacterium]
MATPTPNIAFVTMVRDDHFFLKLWVDYYARHVPRQHLFILLDGFDQTPPDFTAGCQILTLPRSEPGPGWDTRRWKMLADFNATLLGRFDVVVLNDVDEFIVADPASGIPLLDALARAVEVGVITPFAVDVIHRYDLCPAPIDPAQPILRQRPHVRVDATYAKPCINALPVRFDTGGHCSDFPTLNLDPALYLFHFHFFDRSALKARQASRNAIMQASKPDQQMVAGPTWAKSLEEVDGFLLSIQQHGDPIENDFQFDQKRRRMISGWRRNGPNGFWQRGRIFNRRRTYVIPERFRDLI